MIEILSLVFGIFSGVFALAGIWFAVVAYARGYTGQVIDNRYPGNKAILIAIVGAICASITVYHGAKSFGADLLFRSDREGPSYRGYPNE